MPRVEKKEQERKLFVGNLNKEETDEDDLIRYFEKYGQIIDCTVMRDHDKRSRGFGFILFEDAISIDRIIDAKRDNKEFNLDDRDIEIKRALPKVPGGSAGPVRHEVLNRKIFVGGLPSSASEEDLEIYFERYGRVEEVELLRDRETNRLRGFAFVTFDDEDCADKCIQRKTHEICKKLCEVKRAQTRMNIESDNRPRQSRGSDRDGPRQSEPTGTRAPGTMPMPMSEVNKLIQQAFAMGSQTVTGMAPPTVASLLGGGFAAPSRPSPAPNMLLQALMNQTSVPAPAPAPIVSPPPAAPAANNTSSFNQLAQLLQERGIDANALSSLLSKDPAGESPAKASTNNYSTTYPATSTCNYTYEPPKQAANYGPIRDDEPSNYYRPY